MHRALVITVALQGVLACGDAHVERMQALRDEVCDCKTAACAEAAMQKVEQAKLDPKPKVQRLAREMMECAAELMEQGRPDVDPDAETDAEDEATPPETAEPAAASGP